MRASQPFTVLITLVVGLGVAACAGNPAEDGAIEGTAQEVVEQQADAGTDTEVDAPAESSDSALPANWPGLPVPDGELLSAGYENYKFYLGYSVASEEEIERVVAEYLELGFTAEEGIKEAAGQKGIILSNSEWSVHILWNLVEDDTNYYVTYTVSS